MLFGLDPTQLAFLLLTAIAAGGAVLAIAYPWFAPSVSETRLKGDAAGRRSAVSGAAAGGSRSPEVSKDGRRKKVQEALKQIEERNSKKRVTLRTLISRAGLSISVGKFWLLSVLAGGAIALLSVLVGVPWYVSVLAAVAGVLGLPRWVLSYLAKRRQKAFIEGLPDAIEVMVRGLKAGLPVSDAMRVIAAEAGPPIGPLSSWRWSKGSALASQLIRGWSVCMSGCRCKR